ncbi:MAG: DUF3820 family protein [Deltaproteobacteria bacterium]|nr:DUF3820 family protein [Deltaproteobacteria bacterium]
MDELFNPEMPISVDAMSIQHITNEMVADKPPFKGSDAYKKLQVLFANDDSILVAHNAKFKGQPIDPVADMINISSSPVLVPRIPFGKHKGMKMAEVPKDYIQWLSGTDLDEDLEYTVRHYLGSVSVGPDYDTNI